MHIVFVRDCKDLIIWWDACEAAGKLKLSVDHA